ncbi:MAG: hypothetical protein HKL99_10530 [Burkholderiales bacterium]|nr:hypothetical protein [Burkholderiales bacterium]
MGDVVSIRGSAYVEPRFKYRRGRRVEFEACLATGRRRKVIGTEAPFGLVLHRTLVPDAASTEWFGLAKTWTISEPQTGCRVAEGVTRQAALDALAARVAYSGGEAAFTYALAQALASLNTKGETMQPATQQGARVRHRADKIDPSGRVSALCFAKPRAIDMKRATWVMTDAAVTCPKCRALILARSEPNRIGEHTMTNQQLDEIWDSREASNSVVAGRWSGGTGTDPALMTIPFDGMSARAWERKPGTTTWIEVTSDPVAAQQSKS